MSDQIHGTKSIPANPKRMKSIDEHQTGIMVNAERRTAYRSIIPQKAITGATQNPVRYPNPHTRSGSPRMIIKASIAILSLCFHATEKIDVMTRPRMMVLLRLSATLVDTMVPKTPSPPPIRNMLSDAVFRSKLAHQHVAAVRIAMTTRTLLNSSGVPLVVNNVSKRPPQKAICKTTVASDSCFFVLMR